MADNLRNRGEPDTKRVNLAGDWERRYWATKFGVSEEELARAVENVGNTVQKVEAYLSGKH